MTQVTNDQFGTRPFNVSTVTNRLLGIGATTNNWTYDGAGNTLSAVNNAFSYSWDAVNMMTRYLGIVASVDHDGTQLYYHSDHLGTPRLKTNASGNLFSFHHYYPFGLEADEFGTIFEDGFETGDLVGWEKDKDVLSVKYTGHERERFKNLDYMLGRHYSHVTNRFMSVDLARDGWNLYAYVANNPISLVDPTGLAVATDLEELNTLKETLRRAGFSDIAASLGLRSDTDPSALDKAKVFLGLSEPRTFLATRSGADLESHADPLVQMVGAAINSDAFIDLQETSDDLSEYGGAMTDAKNFRFSNKITIRLNYEQVEQTPVPGFWPELTVKSTRYSALVHELGHAYGTFELGLIPYSRVLGIAGASDELAVEKENLWRARAGVSLRSEH